VNVGDSGMLQDSMGHPLGDAGMVGLDQKEVNQSTLGSGIGWWYRRRSRFEGSCSCMSPWGDITGGFYRCGIRFIAR